MALEHLVKRLAAAPAAPMVDFSGSWANELGSTMTITAQGSQVTGTYQSAVSGGGGPVTGTLQGYANGDLISFVVLWPAAAITAWVGQLVPSAGPEILQTLWQMTTNTAEGDEPAGIWNSIYAGADQFVRTS
jgi:hypothetical protein